MLKSFLENWRNSLLDGITPKKRLFGNLEDAKKAYGDIFRNVYDKATAQYDLRKFYAITITLNPKRALEDILVKKRIEFTLSEWDVHGCWLLIPAISPNETIHYHGVIKCTRKSMNNILSSLTHNVGWVKFRKLSEVGAWQDYIFDGHQRTQELEQFQDLIIFHI